MRLRVRIFCKFHKETVQMMLLQVYGAAVAGSSQSGVGKIFQCTKKNADWIGVTF